MRPGSVSASWINGMLTLWITEELAEKLDHPQVLFQPNNEIMLKNNGPKARSWNTSNKTLKPGQVIATFQASQCKGQLPARNYGKTDVMTCKSTVPGHYVLQLPATKANYVARPRKVKKAVVKPAIKNSAEKEFAAAVRHEAAPYKHAVMPPEFSEVKQIAQRVQSDKGIIPADAQLEAQPDWAHMTTTQRFREALRIVNETKASFGPQLDLKFDNDGVLKATMLIEF